MPKTHISINNELIPVYQLTINPPANGSDASNWFTRLNNQIDEDSVGPGLTVNTNVNKTDDLIFEWEGNYYLLEHADLKKHQMKVLQALRGQSSNPFVNKATIKPSYRKRVLTNPKLTLEDDDGIINHSDQYKLGNWFTGAPSMAGAMTLATFTGEKALTGLASVKFLGIPFINSLLIAPGMAALAAFSMNYASNYVMYRLENNGCAPDAQTRQKIWDDSVKKSSQLGLGFLALEGTRELLEVSLGTALENAWGGAVKLGGDLCPAEIRAAVMLSMSLAIGIGMCLGSLIANRDNNDMTRREYYTRALSTFVMGAFAGAVASIDFGNKGFSFLATWAAFSLFPTIDFISSREARRDVTVSVGKVGTSAKLMLSKISNCCPSLEDFASIDDMNRYPGVPGMPPV